MAQIFMLSYKEELPLSIEGDMGWTAELIMGRKGVEFSGGIQAFSFKDHLYVGLVLYAGGLLASW